MPKQSVATSAQHIKQFRKRKINVCSMTTQPVSTSTAHVRKFREREFLKKIYAQHLNNQRNYQLSMLESAKNDKSVYKDFQNHQFQLLIKILLKCRMLET